VHGAILIEEEFFKNMGKNEKMKSKTVPSGYRMAQWQAVVCLSKSGRSSEKFGQVRDLKIYYWKLSWTLLLWNDLE
jgi:hypothetical protein